MIIGVSFIDSCRAFGKQNRILVLIWINTCSVIKYLVLILYFKWSWNLFVLTSDELGLFCYVVLLVRIDGDGLRIRHLARLKMILKLVLRNIVTLIWPIKIHTFDNKFVDAWINIDFLKGIILLDVAIYVSEVDDRAIIQGMLRALKKLIWWRVSINIIHRVSSFTWLRIICPVRLHASCISLRNNT